MINLISSTLFVCHFDPGWYPFDDQTCNIEIGMDRDAAFVQYNATKIQLRGWFSRLQIDFTVNYVIIVHTYS